MALVQRTINQCDVCGHEWIPRSAGERCGNRECRSTKWNAAGHSSIARTPSLGDGDSGATSQLTQEPNMQALRDICTGKMQVQEKGAGDAGATEIPICGKTWWEDGEQYECLMDKGHKNPKHGVAGMVCRLDA